MIIRRRKKSFKKILTNIEFGTIYGDRIQNLEISVLLQPFDLTLEIISSSF